MLVGYLFLSPEFFEYNIESGLTQTEWTTLLLASLAFHTILPVIIYLYLKQRQTKKNAPALI